MRYILNLSEGYEPMHSRRERIDEKIASDMAMRLANQQLAERRDFRPDKVAKVRAEIAGGSYDEDKKLDGSLDGLLDDLNS